MEGGKGGTGKKGDRIATGVDFKLKFHVAGCGCGVAVVCGRDELHH